jgi:tetratricopeptide (TPR) repeat protein
VVTTLWDWLGLRRRDGAGDAVLLIAREVTDRRRSVQGGLAEIRQPVILDGLTTDDFLGLDEVIEEQAEEDHAYAVVLARLTLAAAKAKGFDKPFVDAAIRLESLLPGEDPSHERDRVLREAYTVAQRAGYLEGGRIALSRLGQRAIESNDSDRARLLLQQQMDLGNEEDDSVAEVDAALALGDILRRDGDRRGAQAMFRRAGRSAQRLDHHRGIAEALIRQIELMPRETDLETLAALQRQASEAARRTVDLGLQSRIVLSLAETLRRNGKRDEAVTQLEHGLAIARQIGDLSLESQCLSALVDAERQRGRLAAAVEHERDLVDLDERLGNRKAAGEWATRLGSSLIALDRAPDAIDAFLRALDFAIASGDLKVEQRALGGLGVAYSLAGRPVEALQHLMKALDIARRTHDQRHEARWLGSIGQALWRFNQPEDAIRALSDGLAVARRLDDSELQANLLTLLGRIYVARGQAPRARECFGRALELNRRLGQTTEQIDLLIALASLASETGQIANAIALCEQALQLATVAGDRAAAARLHGKLGHLAQRRHDLSLSLEHLRKALALAESVDQPVLLNQALQHLATAQHAAGDPAAIETYRRAIDLGEQLHDRAGVALMQLNLGLLLDGIGQQTESIRLLREAASRAADLGPSAGALLQRAEAALATMTQPPPFEPRLGSLRHVVADNDAEAGDDAVYRETTLPPL